MGCYTGTQILVVGVGMLVAGAVLAIGLIAYFMKTADPDTQALQPPPW